QLGFVLLEFVDIALLEIQLAGIEVFEKALEQSPGDFVADSRPRYMSILQNLAHHLGHEPIVLAGHRLGRQPEWQTEEESRRAQEKAARFETRAGCGAFDGGQEPPGHGGDLSFTFYV